MNTPVRFVLFLLVAGAIAALAAEPAKQVVPAAKPEWLDSNHDAPNGTRYATFASKTAGCEVSYLVWLPPGYAEGNRRFPVLYHLHGGGTSPRFGASGLLPYIQTAIAEGTLAPCVVVFVNGMVSSYYVDSVDGKLPVESVIMKDLIPHVDATYRTIAQREGRIIEGFSMGGYGAAHLGFKYPDVFGTIVINAGSLHDPNRAKLPPEDPVFAVFGDDQARKLAEHPLTLVRQNADRLRGRAHIRLACGALDRTWVVRHETLHALLAELRIEHEYQILPDVGHSAAAFYAKLGTPMFAFHQKSIAAVALNRE